MAQTLSIVLYPSASPFPTRLLKRGHDIIAEVRAYKCLDNLNVTEAFLVVLC